MADEILDRRRFLTVLGGTAAVLALPATQILAVTKELVIAEPAELEKAVREQRNGLHRTTTLRMALRRNGGMTSWIAPTQGSVLWGVNEVIATTDGDMVVISLGQLRG